MLHGVAVCDGKVLLDPGVEFGHVADLGIIVEDDVGLLLRQKRIVLFKTRVAVGARDDGRLGDGQRAVCHQKAEAVLLTDGLEHALARIGGEGFIQAFLHVGGLGVGPGPGGGAAGDPFGLDGRDRLTVPAGLQHKAELRHGTGQQEPGCQQCRRGAVPPGRAGLEQQRCRPADRGPEQVHKGRWQRDQRGAQDKQVRRYAGQPAQPEQQTAQGAVAGLAPVTPERPAAGQRERRAHVAEIQLLRAQELDFRYMCPAFALAGGWTFWCDRREAGHRPLRRLLFWLGWLPGIAAYLFILRSTLIALPTTFMYLFWPAVCGTAALLLKPRPTRRHRAAAALLAAGLLLACAVPKLCLVLETGWHCEPITAIQPERITRGPAAGTWADTKAADMQECLYEALAPYAGQSVLQAIGEQHGLGFLMADGTLTVAQASVISGTDSDPRFEQYYALLPEKQPDVILYDDAEVRDMAEFHAWIEQHFTITDRYTVQHGTASLQVLVVG